LIGFHANGVLQNEGVAPFDFSCVLDLRVISRITQRQKT
jgi:hypothetical protein